MDYYCHGDNDVHRDVDNQTTLRPGDVGCHHLVLLSDLFALQTDAHSQAETRFVGIAYLVCTAADVLVGHQLPAFSPRLQRACLLNKI